MKKYSVQTKSGLVDISCDNIRFESPWVYFEIGERWTDPSTPVRDYTVSKQVAIYAEYMIESITLVEENV